MLNVHDDAALIAAIEKSAAGGECGSRAGAVHDPGLGEVLIGYRLDPDVGPLVMLAAGGVLAEIHRDRSLRLAPVDLAEAKAMIGEVAALEGARRLSRQATQAISTTRWRRRW